VIDMEKELKKLRAERKTWKEICAITDITHQNFQVLVLRLHIKFYITKFQVWVTEHFSKGLSSQIDKGIFVNQ
jgi:DNA-binding CsgD family transcriptional regulator